MNYLDFFIAVSLLLPQKAKINILYLAGRKRDLLEMSVQKYKKEDISSKK